MLATLGLELKNVLDDSSGARRFVFLMTGPDVFRSEDLRHLCMGIVSEMVFPAYSDSAYRDNDNRKCMK